ncbi:hypothetical protein [Paraburkholderia hospita]|jgi:hypothetical protein|uniref:Uncharacterized protein n=1 Tax=Paraburkholderia hospita TaxID=169430 RepID=A0AAJ4VU42_9BURK|nr:hypothetical protein [Paraburkholderia hospita]AUT76548.1 hypothetical protein C2L64_51295 [Paraburkholderia hospita]AXF05952.1 hypothetical protein CUJ88_47170 [Paraburkholderia hospita]SEI22076.1 hypothetical protein SAMN05192544_104244 [Paraburkholderia hospita]
MSSPMYREIDAPPYRLVINVQPKYRTGSPGQIEGYVSRCTVTRLDGSPVYQGDLQYQIFDGEIFIDLESAIRDGEQRARDAINTGFPH